MGSHLSKTWGDKQNRQMSLRFYGMSRPFQKAQEIAHAHFLFLPPGRARYRACFFLKKKNKKARAFEAFEHVEERFT
jgi:hypothetical protein